MNQLIKKRGLLLLCVLTIGLASCNPVRAQTPVPEFSTQESFFSYLKDFILKLPRAIIEGIKGIGQDLFKGWQSFHTAAAHFWQETLLPAIKNKVKEVVETKKPIIKEEFQKEKEEMKEEIINLYKTIWENLKDIVS